MKTYCPTDDVFIERGDTVRGYEVSPGQYVVVTDSDLASVPLKTVRSIEIEQFVPIAADGEATRFVKQAYYLEPEPIARRAFYLLKQVLAERGLRAIAKIVLKDREQLASLDPLASTMLLSTLYWPDEIRSTAELSLPEPEVQIKPAGACDSRAAHRRNDGRVQPVRLPRRIPRGSAGHRRGQGRRRRDRRTGCRPSGRRHRSDGGALEASVAAAKAARVSLAPVTLAEAASKRPRKAASAWPGACVAGHSPGAEVAQVRRRKSA